MFSQSISSSRTQESKCSIWIFLADIVLWGWRRSIWKRINPILSHISKACKLSAWSKLFLKKTHTKKTFCCLIDSLQIVLNKITFKTWSKNIFLRAMVHVGSKVFIFYKVNSIITFKLLITIEGQVVALMDNGSNR